MANKIFNYDLTNKIYNSDNAAAKIAKYSLIGMALVPVAETIKNVVLSPYNIIANYYNSDREKTGLKESGRTVEPLEKQTSVSKPSKRSVTNNKQKRNWMKTAISLGVVALAVVGVAASGAYYFDAPKVEKGCEGFQSQTYPHHVFKLTEEGIMDRSDYRDWDTAWRKADYTCKPLGIFKGTSLEKVTVDRDFIECADGTCKSTKKRNLI